jgi:hypothetical protein
MEPGRTRLISMHNSSTMELTFRREPDGRVVNRSAEAFYLETVGEIA